MIKKIGFFYFKNLASIQQRILNELAPLIDEIAKLPLHEIKKIQLSSKELVMLRDLNNGFTFKGEYLLDFFDDWPSVLSFAKSFSGDVCYDLPHVVLHKSDFPIHVDRRESSLNIGLFNADLFQVNIWDNAKANIIASEKYGNGEVLFLDTKYYHSVARIKEGSDLRCFLIFTPKKVITNEQQKTVLRTS